MPGTQPLGPRELRLMQGLAQQVTALRPELVNNDATVGEMAWVWAKDHADQGGTWRHRLWFEGTDLAGAPGRRAPPGRRPRLVRSRSAAGRPPCHRPGRGRRRAAPPGRARLPGG